MKANESLQNAIGLIDEAWIADLDQIKRKKNPWKRWTSAAACVAAVGAVTLGIHLTRTAHTPGCEHSEVSYVKPQISSGEVAFLWPWDSLTLPQQYRYVAYDGMNYSYNGLVYNSSHEALPTLDEALIGEKLGNATAYGYDPYDDTKYTIGCEVYAVKEIDPMRLTAIRYDGHEGYHVFGRDDFLPPQNLNELINGLNLTETFPLTRFYLDDSVPYGLTEADSEALWELFVDCGQAALVEDFRPAQKDSLGFAIYAPTLGIANLSWRVSPDGYLWTNIESHAYCFAIGEDAANEIINYALAHKTDSPPDNRQDLVGTVTEIGKGWFKVDDSVMHEDPSDGRIYTFRADHPYISPYLKSGYLKVGDAVLVKYTASGDSPDGMYNAINLQIVKISTSGDIYIEE